MATCANCNAVMTKERLVGVGYDACPSCGSVFIAVEDAAAKGVDVGLIFGGGPGSGNAIGRSGRLCPAHGQPMTSFRVIAPTGALTVERSDCCGGVFLDQSEEAPFLAAAERAARVVQAARESQLAAPGGTSGDASRNLSPQHHRRVEASKPSEHTCPRCSAAYRQDVRDGVTVELCPECGSMFLDAQDTKARGLPTALVFGDSAQAAQERGPSTLSCPRCSEPMTLFAVPFITGPIEVERAMCCGGVFLDGGEYEPFVRACRVAQGQAADAHYAKHGTFIGQDEIGRATSAGLANVLDDLTRKATNEAVANKRAEDAARRASRKRVEDAARRASQDDDDDW